MTPTPPSCRRPFTPHPPGPPPPCHAPSPSPKKPKTDQFPRVFAGPEHSQGVVVLIAAVRVVEHLLDGQAVLAGGRQVVHGGGHVAQHVVDGAVHLVPVHHARCLGVADAEAALPQLRIRPKCKGESARAKVDRAEQAGIYTKRFRSSAGLPAWVL